MENEPNEVPAADTPSAGERAFDAASVERISDSEFAVSDETWEKRQSQPLENAPLEERYCVRRSQGLGQELGVVIPTLIGMAFVAIVFVLINSRQAWFQDFQYIVGVVRLLVMPTIIAVMVPLLACWRISIRFAVGGVVALMGLMTFLIATVIDGVVPAWDDGLYLTQFLMCFVAGLLTAPVLFALFSPWTLVHSTQRLDRIGRSGISWLLELSALSAVLICFLMIDDQRRFPEPKSGPYFYLGLIGVAGSLALSPVLLFLLHPACCRVRHWTSTFAAAIIVAALFNSVVMVLQSDFASLTANLPLLLEATALTSIAFMIPLVIQVAVLRFFGWRTINQTAVRADLQRLKKDQPLAPEPSPLD